MLPGWPMALTKAREATRSLSFWTSVFRHALPVVGVTAFGWPGATIAIFFVLESWAFLTTRSAIEMTFEPGYASPDSLKTPAHTALVLARNLMITGIGFAILVFSFGGFLALVAFSGAEGARFVEHGWKEASFLLGLVGLGISAVVDGAVFTHRLADRTARERAEDTAKVQRMFYRNTGLLLGGVVIIGLASAFDIGAAAVVMAIALTQISFEVQAHGSGGRHT